MNSKIIKLLPNTNSNPVLPGAKQKRTQFYFPLGGGDPEMRAVVDGGEEEEED